jgi:AraC-like DNA-binding protein
MSIVPRVPLAAHRFIVTGERAGEDYFEDFDLWMTLAGCATVESLGYSRKLEPGDVFLVPPRIPVRFRIEENSHFQMVYSHFDLLLGDRVVNNARRYIKGRPPRISLPGIPAMNLFFTFDTMELTEELLQATRRDDEAAQLRVQSLILEVLSEARSDLVRSPAERTHGLPLVDAALGYLEKNMQRPLFVADVARELRVSASHLTRIFQAQLGESPIQALVRMRLARAREMLRDPRWNVQEIAVACGYESLSFFTRVFGRQHGCSPTAYRHQLRKLPR